MGDPAIQICIHQGYFGILLIKFDTISTPSLMAREIYMYISL